MCRVTTGALVFNLMANKSLQSMIRKNIEIPDSHGQYQVCSFDKQLHDSECVSSCFLFNEMKITLCVIYV